jgi:GTP pyrophosphokinase
VDWDGDGGGASHVARVDVVAAKEGKVLATLAEAVASQGGAIQGMRTKHTGPDVRELALDIEVRDVRQLTSILAALRSLRDVEQAERA